ncbi:MAG: hypothetical protein ABR610_07050 [Thermoanaerobaculia bacterium]
MTRVSISLIVAQPRGMDAHPRHLDAFRSELDAGRGDEILVESASETWTLAPQLWARGIDRAGGEIVALTLASMAPVPGWAAAVRDAIGGGVAGVGGAIEPGPGLTALDWAVHLCRYSAYLRPFSNRLVSTLPGDNAAYRRGEIERWRPLWAGGFWETEVDAALVASGARLILTPAIVVHHGHSAGFIDFCRNRFAHGIRSGQSRRKTAPRFTTAVRVLGAPLVPFVLLIRIARRAASRGYAARFLASLPFLLPFLAAWALGEAVGGCRSRETGLAARFGERG